MIGNMLLLLLWIWYVCCWNVTYLQCNVVILCYNLTRNPLPMSNLMEVVPHSWSWEWNWNWILTFILILKLHLSFVVEPKCATKNNQYGYLIWYVAIKYILCMCSASSTKTHSWQLVTTCTVSGSSCLCKSNSITIFWMM